MVKWVRFCCVGLLNTGIDLGIFSLLFYVFEVPLLVSNSIAYLAAVANSFLLNKFWTFSETRAHGVIHHQAGLFFALGLIGVGLSNLVVWSLAAYMPEIFAKLVSIGVTLVYNYSTSRFIVFPNRDTPRA